MCSARDSYIVSTNTCLMDNVHTALALGFLAERNVAVNTDSFNVFRLRLEPVVQNCFGVSAVDFDFLASTDFYNDLVLRATVNGKLANILILRNLEKIQLSMFQRLSILKFLNEMEQFGTVASSKCLKKSVRFSNGYEYDVPELCMILLVCEVGDSVPFIHQHLKERFWFCQLYSTSMDPEYNEGGVQQLIVELRSRMSEVYMGPTVKEYISTLLTFTRSHRLCSLSPLYTRPTFRALEGIQDLACALAVWKARDKSGAVFVTPELVKIAYRKVGYWLVNWETNKFFVKGSNGLEEIRRTEISILTGDWYGSAWSKVMHYLGEHESEKDWASATGFTNSIVEEVLLEVAPPL